MTIVSIEKPDKPMQQSITASIRANSLITTDDIVDRRSSQRVRNTHHDYELSKQQKEILKLIPKCGWAIRYVDLVVKNSMLCNWKPYYRGEFINEPYLDQLIESIRPSASSQKAMRMKAIKLQLMLGLFGFSMTEGVGRTVYDVWHPLVIEESDFSEEYFKVTRSAQDNRKAKNIHNSEFRRFYIEDDMFDQDASCELLNVLDKMRRYCATLDCIDNKAEQGKIFNNMLHLQLENTEKNPYWANPNNYDKKTGKLLIEQSIEDLELTLRDSYKGNGQARYSPHLFIWPGDVEHLKLDDPIEPELIESANMLAKMGAAVLNVPTSYLIGEEGTANHWNEAELGRQIKSTTIQPVLETHDQFFNDYAFQPLIRNHLKNTGNTEFFKKYNIDLICLRSDTSALDNPPDNSAMIFDLFKEGIATRKQVADAVGLESLAEIPEGMTEYDHWLCVKGKQGAMESEEETVTEPERPTLASQALALLQ